MQNIGKTQLFQRFFKNTWPDNLQGGNREATGRQQGGNGEATGRLAAFWFPYLG